VIGQTDSRVHGTTQLHVRAVNQTVAFPDELIDLVSVTGAGLDVFTEEGRYAENLLAAGQVTS